MSVDRLPEHLSRVAYVESKETLYALKMMALADTSSVSKLIREATTEFLRKRDPKGRLIGEFYRVSGIREQAKEEGEEPPAAAKPRSGSAPKKKKAPPRARG